MGRVTGCWLDLIGQLRPISLSWGLGQWSLGQWRAHIEWSSWEPLLNTKIWLDIGAVDPLHFEEANEECSPFYVPVRWGHIPQLRRTDMDAILLRIVDDPSGPCGVFERIGVVSNVENWDDYEDLDDNNNLNTDGSRGNTGGDVDIRPAMLAELGEELKESLPCLRYEDGLHTIRII
jgi:hypothetical protein